MSDYVSCPACKGKGLIPLEDAEAIKAHASVTASEAQQAAWEHRRDMVRLDNEVRARNLEARKADAEKRFADLEAACWGRSGPEAGP